MKLVLAFLTILFFSYAHCAMTEAQIKSATKLLKNVCVPKSKISNDQLDTLHEGGFTQEPEVLSYMECILRTGQIMKDGKLNLELLKSQTANLPPHMSEPGLITVEHCKDSPKSSDKFLAAAEFYQCFYEDNPANFFLP